MNMLWFVDCPIAHDLLLMRHNFNDCRNTQIIDTCIIFREWHISSNGLFALSFFGILGLAIVYEGVRLLQTQFEVFTAHKEVESNGTNLGALPEIGERNPLIERRPKRRSP